MFSAATVTMFLDVATHVVDMLLYNQTVDFPEELLIHWDMVGNVMVRIVVSVLCGCSNCIATVMLTRRR